MSNTKRTGQTALYERISHDDESRSHSLLKFLDLLSGKSFSGVSFDD